MKFIVAYLPTQQLERTITALVRIHVHGLTISNARGFGQEHDQWRPEDHEYLATEMERYTRVEVACQDSEIDVILNAISHAANLDPTNPGSRGKGKVFVFPLLDVIRLKTGECGEQALGGPIPNSPSD